MKRPPLQNDLIISKARPRWIRSKFTATVIWIQSISVDIEEEKKKKEGDMMIVNCDL